MTDAFTLNGAPLPAASDVSSPAPGRRFASQRAEQDIAARNAEPQAKQPAPAPEPGKPAAADGAPTPRVKLGNDEFEESVVRDALAQKAERDSARAALPTADAYELKFSDKFELPPGVGEFAIDPESDHARLAKGWAHANGVSQQAFSELLDIYGATQVEGLTLNKAARDHQIDLLGANGPVRVDAITTWMDAKGYGALKPMLVTADMVKTFEKLMGDMRGGSHFSQAHRDAPDANEIPGLDNMTFREARAAQDALLAKRNRR